VILLALGACASSAPEPSPSDTPAVSARGLPLGELRIHSAGAPVLDLRVEIAETSEALARGLMHVEHLADDEGMAFLMSAPTRSGFWMKNTLIPLDIAFWDQEGRIVEILQMQPCTVADADCPHYRPESSYVGALEVNLGRLGRSGVEPGDVVELERR
jgi:hypothetical protein